jgi:hypothetical protein
MITFEEFATAFIGFLPLYFALVIVPSFVSSAVLYYASTSGLVRSRATALPLPGRRHEIVVPSASAAYSFAMIVVVAPFVEELVFRGVPLLIHPALAWVGTLGWALAHSTILGMEAQARITGGGKAVLVGVSHALFYVSSGVFYMLVWLQGFVFGAVAITYHMLHNFMVYILEYGLPSVRRARGPVVGRPVLQPRVPAVDAAPGGSGRRVIRRADLGSSLYLPGPDELVERQEF